MSEDIATRMCNLEAREDKDLRAEVAKLLITDLLVDRDGKSVDPATFPKWHNRGALYEEVKVYFGDFQLEATAHCANDARLDASQVHYLYDKAGHFKYPILSSDSSSR